MKFISRLILAICAVCLVSIPAYAKEVKAYDYNLTVTVDEDNYVTVEYPEDTDTVSYEFVFDHEEYGSVQLVKLNGNKIAEYFDETLDFDLDDIFLDMEIEGTLSKRDKYDGCITVEMHNLHVIETIIPDTEEDPVEKERSGKTAGGESTQAIRGLYKQTIAKEGEGTVEADYYDARYYAGESFYAYKGDSVFLMADEDSGYAFDSWSDGGSKDHNVKVSGVATYKAVFKKAATGISLKINGKSDSSLSVYNGSSITLATTITPSGGGYRSIRFYPESDGHFSRNGNTWTAIRNTNSPVDIYVGLVTYDGDEIFSNHIKVSVSDKKYSPSEFTIKADQDYLTEGYSLILTPDFSVMGNIYDPIVWTVEGEGTLTGIGMPNSGKTVKDLIGVELKASTGKIDSGKTGTIKVTASLPDGKGQGIPATADKTITIYPQNSISYSDSNKNLSFTSPGKVNTGTTSGVDNDDKDTTKTAISDVKGIKIHLYSGDKFLGMTAVAKDKGTSGTIDSTTLGKMSGSVSTGLSGDSADLKVRALPCDGDGKYNKRVYAETKFTVYKVVVTFTKADGTTADYITYRPDGYKLNVADAIAEVVKSTDGKVTEVDGSTDTTVTVGTSAAQNKHTAVLGASRANAAAGGGANASARADDSALDRVPKTGQNNTFVFVMVALVVCAVGGGLYVYNKKLKKS